MNAQKPHHPELLQSFQGERASVRQQMFEEIVGLLFHNQ